MSIKLAYSSWISGMFSPMRSMSALIRVIASASVMEAELILKVFVKIMVIKLPR